ncbi:MAG: HAMP domain-containing histidine kinase, partial [Myxococcales bacterium]|nr:HAMP domain-containing histidine kinase [Myxococcales bacterium]
MSGRTHREDGPESDLTDRAAIDHRSFLALHGVFAGSMALVLVLGGLGAMPTPDPRVVVGLIAAAGVLAASLRVWGDRAAGPVLIGDTALLTALLASTGGVSNPFTLLYLLPVLLASLALSWRWAAAMAALTTACFAGLYAASPAHHHMDMAQHLVGMVAAYGVTVPVLAAGVLRFRRAVGEAEAEAVKARRSRANAERLASLAALAGGAAHELATPLSSVLLVARELERNTTGDVQEDARLIAQEILRCREVLDQLVADAGGMGEGWVEVD